MMKAICLFFLFIIGVDSMDISNCNKLWETSNVINNVPIYSMGIYMCVQNGVQSTTMLSEPVLVNKKDNIKNYLSTYNFTNQTKINNATNQTRFYNTSLINITNSSFLNDTYHNKIKTMINETILNITNYTTTPSSYNVPTPSSILNNLSPSTTTPYPYTTPSTTSNTPSTTPSQSHILSPSPSSSYLNPPDNINPINNINGNNITNQTFTDIDENGKNVENLNVVPEEISPYLYVSIVLSIIIGIILVMAFYRLLKYLIENKKLECKCMKNMKCKCMKNMKCKCLGKNVDPKKNEETDTKEKVIDQQLSDMERAKLRSIERKKTMEPFKALKHKNMKLRRIKTTGPLDKNSIPKNKGVRDRVKQDLLKQAQNMPDGKGKDNINKLINRIEKVDRPNTPPSPPALAKEQIQEIQQNMPPRPKKNAPIITRQLNQAPPRITRKSKEPPPGMGYD